MKRITAFLCVLACICMIMTGCSDSDAIKYSAELYFVNAQGTGIVSETREITASEVNELLTKVVDGLISGPVTAEARRIIPEGTRLIKAELEGDTAQLDFSKEFYNCEETDSIFVRTTVVSSVTAINGIKNVHITVNGNELITAKGDEVGIMNKDDIIYTTEPDINEKRYFKLYFANADGNKLVAEAREIVISQNESVELQVLKELFKGPENNSLARTVPGETKIISVETKEGICFVNLSQDFISRHTGGTSGETMTIYSIVNTLTELDNIDRVQFLIEGQKNESFIHMMINEPFESNDMYIE